MARSYGLAPWALFSRVILPGALPSILVGLRYALGIMWLTLIVAETISASAGIGYMTMNAREFLQTDVVLLGILVYALLGKLADVADPPARAALPRLAPGLPDRERPRHERGPGAARPPATCRGSPGRGATAARRAGPRGRPAPASPSASASGRCWTRLDLAIASRAVRRHRRPLRRRQEHAAAPAGRAGDRLPPASMLLDGRPFTGLPPGVRMLFQDARLLPWQRVDRQCRHRPRPGLAASGPSGAGRCRPGRPRPATGRPCCPAASASAWPWPAPWSAGRGCCCWTSRSARSTR